MLHFAIDFWQVTTDRFSVVNYYNDYGETHTVMFLSLYTKV